MGRCQPCLSHIPKVFTGKGTNRADTHLFSVLCFTEMEKDSPSEEGPTLVTSFNLSQSLKGPAPKAACSA